MMPPFRFLVLMFELLFRLTLVAGISSLAFDHATLVVGYGTDAYGEHWIMKNSWGTSWGEDGYMRVAIQDGVGVCAIQSSPVYPQMGI